ncbi:MAG TPA: efflux RND transporter periplasmic adaptor subunit [Polyangiaceae bacterium]|nr:efflux RND transporter periplasmic adaptor subunit [Polyangiaceae bacterium]
MQPLPHTQRPDRKLAPRGPSPLLRLLLPSFLALFVALPGAASLSGCKKKSSDDASAQARKPVLVHEVQRGDITDLLSYPAELLPYAEVRVFSTIPDRILDFPWKDGQEIQRGQRVALVRKEGLDRGLEQMAAQLDGLDAQIRNMESELGRTRDLADAGVLTQNVLDNVETQHTSLQAQRRALAAGRAQLAVSAGNAMIAAPISGVIAGKTVEKGDMASPQMPLCRIMQIDQLKVTFRLIEADVAKVRLKQEVVLTLAAHPGKEFRGAVTTVLPYLDRETRTNTVEVTVDNPVDAATGQRPLKPGMFGQARLLIAEHKNVVLAPEPALLLDENLIAKQKQGETLRRAMVVGPDGLAQERVVRLGARKGTTWEILEGLNDKERLIVRGQHGLKAGQPVEIVGVAADKP